MSMSTGDTVTLVNFEDSRRVESPLSHYELVERMLSPTRGLLASRSLKQTKCNIDTDDLEIFGI